MGSQYAEAAALTSAMERRVWEDSNLEKKNELGNYELVDLDCWTFPAQSDVLGARNSTGSAFRPAVTWVARSNMWGAGG